MGSVSGLHQSKAQPQLPNTKFCSTCCHLTAIPMSSCGPPIRSPVWGVRVNLGGRKLYQQKSRPNIHIRLLYTLYAYLVPFATIHNVADTCQMTDRAIRIGRLCYSICGLKMSRVLAWNTQNGEMTVSCFRFSAQKWQNTYLRIVWNLLIRHVHSSDDRRGRVTPDDVHWH